MTMKLIQKSLLNGTREFELVNDVVYVRIKKFFKEEKHTVSLLILNPDPIINPPYVEFYDRYKGHLLLSLLINKPNAHDFNTFIDAIKQGTQPVSNMDSSEASLVSEASRTEGLARNLYEEPPEFEEHNKDFVFKPVNVSRLEDDLEMLKRYLNEDDIRPLLDALETLKTEPANEAAYYAVVDSFNTLGINQGAVLTYAHYLKVLLSESLRS